MLVIQVVRVTGRCNAGFAPGDRFLLRDWRITPCGHGRACQVAFATVVNNAGRVGLSGGRPVYVACPDPGTGEGGNVLMKLSLEADDEADPDPAS